MLTTTLRGTHFGGTHANAYLEWSDAIMGKLTDIEIRNWIKNKTHFEAKGDGAGLYLSYRENFSTPLHTSDCSVLR